VRLIACGLDLIYKACGLAALILYIKLAALRPIRIRGSRRWGWEGIAPLIGPSHYLFLPGIEQFFNGCFDIVALLLIEVVLAIACKESFHYGKFPQLLFFYRKA